MRRNILIPTFRKPPFTLSEQEKEDLVAMLVRMGSPLKAARSQVEGVNGRDAKTFEDIMRALLKQLRVSR